MTTKSRTDVQKTVVKTIRSIVTDFIRYHVQDNSVAIGMARSASATNKFESMKRNPETGRYYPLQVDYDTNNMTITDAMGNQRHVKKDDGLYNKLCREYWFEGKPYTNSARVFMASNAVVHQIDGVLQYENMKEWREVVKEAIKALN